VEEEREKEERAPIDERIEELEKMGYSKADIVLQLYEEGYPTQEIMKRHLPLKALKRMKASEDEQFLGAMKGRVRGEGYLDEFKNMIRAQVSRSRELTELCGNVGLGVMFAALHKSGVGMDDFRRIALNEGTIKDALGKAAETAFKALEYYKSDRIIKVEEERDEARAYASLLEAQIEDLKRKLDPKFRLEKMIYNLVLLSGTARVDPNALMTLVDKWLELEVVAG